MILIVTQHLRAARSLENILRLRGLITKRCTPTNSLKYIFPSLSAIILLYPEEFYSLDIFLHNITSLGVVSPLFAITGKPDDIPQPEMYTDIIRSDSIGKHLIEIIQQGQRRTLHRLSGDFTLFELDASIPHKSVKIAGCEILLTKKQMAILRYLICMYPKHCTPSEIADAVYTNGCAPDDTCIRVHICSMNKKFRSYLASPLVVSLRGDGYTLDKSLLLAKEPLHATT